MYSKNIQNYRKKYNQIKKTLADTEKNYDDVTEKAKCHRCEKYYRGNVDKELDRHNNCLSCDMYSIVEQAAKEEDIAVLELERLIDQYAQEVFEFYCKYKPHLRNKKTGETVTWIDEYGEDFSVLSTIQRHSLVGLIENYGSFEVI